MNGQPPEERSGAGADRYRATLEAAEVGFCVLKILYDEAGEPCDYRFLAGNAAFVRHTGFINPIGRTITELVPGFEIEWVRRYAEIARTGVPASFMADPPSMGREFEIQAMRIGPPEAHEVGVLFIDATERRRAEAAEREANNRTLTILESIAEGFVRIDRDWRFVYVNGAAERILGVERESFVGRSMWETYPGLIGSELESVYLAAMAGRHGSLTTYYPDHRRHYEVSAGPSTEGVTVFFRDVSERVRSEEEREELLRRLENETRKLRLASDKSYIAMAIFRGEDLIVDYANAPYMRLIGYRGKVGQPLLEIMPEFADQPFPEIIRQVMRTGETIELTEITAKIRKRPGHEPEEVILSARYHALYEPDGSISGVFAQGMDVTEIVRARRVLAARAEETALGSRRKDEFLATLAHELRNPLAPIRLSTELLGLLEPGEPEFDESRAVIQRQVDHMARLVDDLLDVSRVARGKIDLKQESLELADVLAAAIETSRPGIAAAGHRFEVRLPDAAVRVAGDRTRLAQVVGNLLNNAARYTPAGGAIQLEVEAKDEEAIIRVRDDGIGIAPEMLGSIFEMFAQGDVRLSQSRGGLGIGLTLARTLVELHGGRIEARSEGLGRGSEFIVRLPIVHGAGDPEPSPAPPAAADGRPLRVLVVDDNEDGAWTLARLIAEMGHETRVAHTGAEAIGASSEFLPHAILLDVGLPDLPGYEVARRLRADPRLRKTLVIGHTGWGREEDRSAGRAAGFDAHLVKPLSRDDLARALSRATPEP